jgi:DNA-directed RNA polymerase subunit H (RpoH/RPB5)
MNNQQAIVKSFNTIIEMLKDRKMDVSQINQTAVANGLFQSSLSNVSFKIQIENISIIYYLNTKFKLSEMRKILGDNIDTDLMYIFIVNDKISLSNMKSFNGLLINFQIFHIKELQFNITKHILVPKHEKINDQEIQEILTTFSLKTKFQLPLILKSDPMSRYLGLKGGDVVRVTRNSPASGEYFVYRCCM